MHQELRVLRLGLVVLMVLVVLVVLAELPLEVGGEGLCGSPIFCPGIVEESVLVLIVLHCSDLVGLKV